MATQLDFSTRQLANPSAGIQQNLSDLGAMFGQFQKNKVEEERYQAELARQKVLDDRATQLWNRQEAAREAQLAGEKMATPNIMGARAVGYDESGKAGEYTAAYEAADKERAAAENVLMQAQIAKSPELQAKYNQALAGEDFMQMNAEGQMVAMNADDRARIERLTREQVLGKYKPQTGVEALTLALQGNRSTEPIEQTQVYQTSVPQQPQYRQVPIGTQVVQEATQGTPGVKGKTAAQFVNENGLVNDLFGTPSVPYKEGPMTSVRKYKIADVEAKYDKLLAPYQEQMRNSAGLGITAKNNTTFNTAAKNAESLIAKKEAEIKEIMRDKSQPKGTEGIVSRDVWKKANADEQVAIVNSMIGNIKDPAKRTALEQEFAKSIKGVAPVEGKKEVTKTIYGKVPVLAPGESVSSSNTYKGEVVTTYSGSPVDMSGVPVGARGPIVDAHKMFAKKVNDMFSVQDALAVTSKRVIGELASKHGVTRKEMDVEGILKSAGMDGTMTPQQERQVKMWENELASMTEQYKMNQNQANANREYNLNVQKMMNQMSQFQATLSQSDRHHRENLKATAAKDSAYMKSLQTKSGQLFAEQMFDPTVRAKRIDDRTKALLPQHTSWHKLESTEYKDAREAAMKEIELEDAAIIKRMKETQL